MEANTLVAGIAAALLEAAFPEVYTTADGSMLRLHVEPVSERGNVLFDVMGVDERGIGQGAFVCTNITPEVAREIGNMLIKAADEIENGQS